MGWFAPSLLRAVSGSATAVCVHRSESRTAKKGKEMATPMTPDQLIGQLRKWDVPFTEIEGWRHHNRDRETGRRFGPVYGCMTHHTGDDAPDDIDRRVVRNGREGLPGPLAQFGLNDKGVVELIGWGSANHAGGGDPDVLRAVIDQSYRDYPPPTDKHEGEAGAVDGNDCFYGCEAYYSGKHRMTAEAYRTLAKLWAAICDFHSWTAKSVIGHKEWSDWKVDPGYLDMKVLRRDVQALLDQGPVPDNAPPPLPPNIVKALEASRRYQRALESITAPRAQDEVAEIIVQVKHQRHMLRNFREN